MAGENIARSRTFFELSEDEQYQLQRRRKASELFAQALGEYPSLMGTDFILKFNDEVQAKYFQLADEQLTAQKASLSSEAGTTSDRMQPIDAAVTQLPIPAPRDVQESAVEFQLASAS